jgi:hypothetical protein
MAMFTDQLKQVFRRIGSTLVYPYHRIRLSSDVGAELPQHRYA